MTELDKNRWFVTSRGQKLDVIFHAPDHAPRAIILVYPCVGGTSRALSVPHEALLSHGFAVVEYHPPIHGRSSGHTEMPLARRDLYEYLFSRRLDRLPVILFGHSAGANALLQLNELLLQVRYVFLVQPVLCFRSSLVHMYANGTQGQFIEALLRFTTAPDTLREVLAEDAWSNPTVWHAHGMRAKLDAVSRGLMIGTFLEDLYLPGYSVGSKLREYSGRCTVACSPVDDWYPVAEVHGVARECGIEFRWIESASDHFLTGAWDDVWRVFLDSLSTM